MKNNICPECGMPRIDCGNKGIKTINEIALEKKVERLQEQINEANEIIISFDKLVGELTGTVFQNVLDYYKKYNVDRYKKSGV